MTVQKLSPCPDCGADAVGIWTYDSGWRRAECDACLYIAEPAQNLVLAARNHNRRATERLALGSANAARDSSGSPNETTTNPPVGDSQ